jgi:hypothetical protein
MRKHEVDEKHAQCTRKVAPLSNPRMEQAQNAPEASSLGIDPNKNAPPIE